MTIDRLLSAAKNLKELIGYISFYFLLLANPLSPDLVVSYEETPYFSLSPPDSDIHSNTKLEDKDSSILTITFWNKSKDPISNIEIEISGIANLDSIRGRSSSFRIDNEISKAVEIEKTANNQIFLKNIKNIPAGHNIQIQIIGTVLTFIVEDRIKITSNARSQQITRMTKVSGFWGFFSSQSSTIFAMIFTILLLIGLRRFYQQGSMK